MTLQSLIRMQQYADHDARKALPPRPERGIRLVSREEVRASLGKLRLVQSSDEVFVLVPRP